MLAEESAVWHYDVEVGVCGSGASELLVALRVRYQGASVLVLEQNFDTGGKFIHSGGWTSLGGGDHIQEGDKSGANPDNMSPTASLRVPEELDDRPDRLFGDVTDWSVVSRSEPRTA